MEIKKADELEFPICPYCKTELKEVKLRTVKAKSGLLFISGVFFCPSCKSVLGYSR